MPKRTVKVSDSSVLNEKKSQPSPIEALFNSLINLLMITGSYSTLVESYRRGNVKRVTWVRVLHLIYCFTLVTCLWFNFIRYTYQINEEVENGLTTGLSTVLCTSVILFAFSFHATTSLWTFSTGLRKTMELFLQYDGDFGLRFDATSLRRKVFKINAVAYMCCCLLAIAFPFLMALMSEESTFRKTFLSVDLIGLSGLTEMWAYIFPILSVTALIVWGSAISGLNVYVLLCYITCKELSAFHDSFVQVSTTLTTEEDIEQHRTQFERIVHIVHQINACLYHCTCVVISTCFAVVCFLLYGVVQGNIVTDDVLVSTTFVFAIIVMTVITVGYGIAINNKMHAPLETLYSLNLCKMSEKAVMQVSIFINRLSSHPLGISVYGFFVVEKSTVLMIFGTILTYFIVMIQMPPSSRDAPIAAILNATQA